MGSKDDIGLHIMNFCNNLSDRGGTKRRLAVIPDLARLHHLNIVSIGGRFENLRPAVGKPSVAHDENLGLLPKLTRDRLHSIGTPTRDKDNRIRAIHFFQHGRNIVHHLLKGL